MNRIYVYLILLLFPGLSCSDFLEEESQDLVYVTSVEDLSELLVGSCYQNMDNETSVLAEDYGSFLHVMDDDTEAYVKEYTDASNFWRAVGFHEWQQNPFQARGEPFPDIPWTQYYKHIAVLNTILVEVEEFQGQEGYERVKGEAHFLRAYYYFMLVNMYAKPYNKETAELDLGVPLKLTDYVEDKKFGRATVQEVYVQIVDDLKDAITCLEGVEQKSVRRASVYAANALLGRVYLYMGEWELAEKQCDEVLTKGAYALEDYNGLPHCWCGMKDLVDQMVQMTGMPEELILQMMIPEIGFDLTQTAAGVINSTSTETIFAQGKERLYLYIMQPAPGSTQTLTFKVSSELMNSFQNGDIRKKLFLPGDANIGYWISSKYYDFWGTTVMPGETSDIGTIRLAEVYLNKAEALAMQDRDKEAAIVLKQLRDKRFVTGGSTEITETGKDLIGRIRQERRWELCFEGHRWFDLRRYAVSRKYADSKEIKHTHYEDEGVATGYYLLEKYEVDADAYVLPIPSYAMEYNDGVMVDNKRKVRTLIGE